MGKPAGKASVFLTFDLDRPRPEVYRPLEQNLKNSGFQKYILCMDGSNLHLPDNTYVLCFYENREGYLDHAKGLVEEAFAKG